MPLYSYKARSDSGKIFSGEIKTTSKDSVTALLAEKGFIPIEIIEKNIFNDVSQLSIFKKKVKVKDLAVFCRQFAIVLEAGVPIATAMDVLREQTLNPTMKSALNDTYDAIQKGIALSEAMKQNTDVFPDFLINMVEAGEISGQLDIVFRRMAEHFEKEYKLNHKIKSAMMYPIILCITAVIVIAVLMMKVVPTFAEVLKSFGSELPLFTKVLIGVSNFFKSFWWVISLILIGISFVLNMYSKTDEGKRFLSELAIKVPVVKTLTKTIATARLMRTMGTMISSGVLLLNALEVVQKVIGNVIVSEKISFVIDEVKRGKGFSHPLTAIKYFPPMLVSMVKIGEESGNLDFALDKAADFYDQEVETAMKQLTTLIEPLIMVLMGVVVAFIILSILYPMLSVYQSLAQ